MALELPNTMDFLKSGKSKEEYLDDLYSIMSNDFKIETTNLIGKKVCLVKEPSTEGREYTFNHITRYDKSPEIHLDFNRCKKIPWLAPILNSCPNSDVKCWTEQQKYVNKKSGKRKTVTRTIVWYEEGNLKLILQEKNDSYFLITSFTVAGERAVEKLNQEYELSSTKLY
jgi:hypothetical protein